MLQPLLEAHHWQSVGQLFASPKILKLGYGIKSDFKVLSSLHEEMKKGICSAKNVTDLDITKSNLLEKYPSVFSYSDEKHKGLSDLVYRCFGLPLDKREGFSNWAARPLNKSHITYAAGDVRCLIDIYNYLNMTAREQGIGDWINVKKYPSGEKKNLVLPTKEEKMMMSRGSKETSSQSVHQTSVSCATTCCRVWLRGCRLVMWMLMPWKLGRAGTAATGTMRGRGEWF